MATPRINGGHLAPHITFTVARIGGGPAGAEGRAVAKARELITARPEASIKGEGVDPGAGQLEAAGVSACAGLIYGTTRPPGWAASTGPWAIEQDQLLLAVRRGGLLAIYCSEPRLKNALVKWIGNDGDDLELIPAPILETAFCHGEAKALWLRGAHRSTTIKPDRKALTGTRLTDALDPVGDQTYSYSASRNRVVADDAPDLLRDVTTNPSEAKVSYGPSGGWTRYLRVTGQILRLVEQAQEADPPGHAYPVLAERATDLSAVEGAYEVAPPTPADIAIMSEVDEEDVEAAELLGRALLEIRATSGPTLELAVGLRGSEAGCLVVQPRLAGRGVRLDVGVAGEPSDPGSFHRIRDAIQRVGLTVYYESGHVLTEEGVSHQALRSLPFHGWEFRAFDGFDIALEKPARADEVHALTGTTDDRSLFSWVVREFAEGWLACDDGPDEVADFEHLSADRFSLIHVKAATSSGKHRGVSAVAYEQVVAQVQKNLHNFDPERLIAALGTGSRANSTAVWQNGVQQPSRHELLEALEDNLRHVKLGVVIVQPHMRRSVLDRVRANPEGSTHDGLRLVRLDLLLNETAQAAAGLGAGLVVIGEEF